MKDYSDARGIQNLILDESKLTSTELQEQLTTFTARLATLLRIPLALDNVEGLVALLNEDIILIGYIEPIELLFGLIVIHQITLENLGKIPLMDLLSGITLVYDEFIKPINNLRRMYETYKSVENV